MVRREANLLFLKSSKLCSGGIVIQTCLSTPFLLIHYTGLGSIELISVEALSACEAQTKEQYKS